MDIKDIKDLILTINNTDIDKLDLEKGDFKLSLSKNTVKNTDYSYTPIIREVEAEAKEEVETPEIPMVDENLYTVKSPMVGVYYESPSPDADPFVSPGSSIEKGDSLCIIEAMKIMNEIEAEVSGEVLEILVSNGDIIQYGQDLMRIRRI